MAKASVGTLYFVEHTVYKAQKALVAAKFNGILLNEQKFDVQKDSKKPDFLAKNPTGKVPFLETDYGCIFTSNAIARYIARYRADTALYGKSFDHEGEIDTWLEFCTHAVEIPLMTWVYPVMGLMEDMPEVTKDAQKDTKIALDALEVRLKASTYLLGDFLSLADIALVCALREGFVRVFDAAFRKPYPKTTAWFENCCKMPQFKAVLGDTKLCTKAESPKPVLPAYATGKDGKKADAAVKGKAAAAPAEKKQAAPKAAASSAPAPSGASEEEIKAVGDEIRILKEKLKADGLSGKKVNDHEQVKALVEKLNALKAAGPAPAAAAAAPKAAAPAAGGDVEKQILAVGDEVRSLKEKLKNDGLSGKQINEHAEIKVLVDKLKALKDQLPAGGAAPAAAPAATPAAPPAAGGGGDLDAKIKQVGDDIRALKEKLKGEGLSGKKVNDHEDVKRLVAQLTELKAQQSK